MFGTQLAPFAQYLQNRGNQYSPDWFADLASSCRVHCISKIKKGDKVRNFKIQLSIQAQSERNENSCPSVLKN